MKNNLKGGLLFVILTSPAIFLMGCSEPQEISVTPSDAEKVVETEEVATTQKVDETEIVEFAKTATLDLLSISGIENINSQIEDSKGKFFAKKPDYFTGAYIEVLLEELGVRSDMAVNFNNITPEVIGDISINDSNNSVDSYGNKYWTVKIPLRLTFELEEEKVVREEDVVVEVVNDETATKGEENQALIVSAIKIEE